MARKRMVSPGLLTSESVARLTPRARFALVGLWMYLDDVGRGKDNANLIRAHTWPLDRFTSAAVETDLVSMAGAGLICRYEYEGTRYLHSPSWSSYQSISHPTPSRIPPCAVHEPEAWTLFCEEFGITSGAAPEVSDVVEGSSDHLDAVQRPSCPHGLATDSTLVCPLCRRRAEAEPGF